LCAICLKRRGGQLDTFLKTPKNTIWIDEVADENNKVALLTVELDISKWLDGTWFKTIIAQTIDEWKQAKASQNCGNIHNVANFNEALDQVDTILTKNMFCVLDSLIEPSVNSKNVHNHLNNISLRFDAENTPTKEQLAEFCFTQNPSPGRLYRVWQSTKAFFDDWKNNQLDQTLKRDRIEFTLDPKDKFKTEHTYRLSAAGLSEPITVLCKDASKGEFWTIDALVKIKDQEAYLFPQNNEEVSLVDESLLPNDPEIKSKLTSQSNVDNAYSAYMSLLNTPVMQQILIPANKVPDVMRDLCRLYHQHFAKVQGKLPLNSSLVVANRKMPLYVLLDAGHRLLPDSEQACVEIKPWWNTSAPSQNDDFFGYHPTQNPNGDGFSITALTRSFESDKKTKFWLTPGRFKWQHLGASTDRYTIPNQARSHDLPKLHKVWALLSKHLSTRQLHIIESQLNEAKMRLKIGVTDDDYTKTYEEFAETVLKNSLGNMQWEKNKTLLEESLKNGMILEALELFMHVLKLKPQKEESHV